MKTKVTLRKSDGIRFPMLALVITLSWAILSGRSANAITIDFDSGYTAGDLLESQPSTGTQWSRTDSSSGTADASFEITANTGFDNQQGATSQPSSDPSIDYSLYSFTPSSTDLGGTFDASSSVMDYSFCVAFGADPNPDDYPTDCLIALRVGSKNGTSTCAINIPIEADGIVDIWNGTGTGTGGVAIPAKTTKGGTTNFIALGGVFFTVSGQINFATKTYTVSVNGIPQTVGGPTGSTNFGFFGDATTCDFDILNVAPTASYFVPCTVSHIQYSLTPTYSAPITITEGGTYSGNWLSTSPTTPAVTIDTTAPVTIENSIIKGPDILIDDPNQDGHLTIKNCKGYGVNPNVSGQVMPKFLYMYNAESLVVENNYMESTAGIELGGNYDKSQSVTIQYNRAVNIDGRHSDGAGGYLSGAGNFDRVSFVQLSDMLDLALGNISWNEVIELPNESRVEDTINIYQSGGKSGTPALIYNNYIQGGYTYPFGGEGSGTGITCGDGATGDTVSNVPSYVNVYNNVVVNYATAGIATYCGNNINFYQNRAYTCGTIGIDTPDPSTNSAGAQNAVGIQLFDLYGTGSGVFFNNTATENQVGWVNPIFNVPYAGMYDYYFPDYSAGATANTWYDGDVTSDIEKTQANWYYQQKSLNEITVGPNF